MSNENCWTFGEIKTVGNNSGINQFKYFVLLENDDLQEIDLSDKSYVWEYIKKKQCDLCDAAFDNKKGLNVHKRLVHEQNLPEKHYKCEHCNITMNSLHDLNVHKERIQGEHVTANEQQKIKTKVHFNSEEIQYNEQEADEQCNERAETFVESECLNDNKLHEHKELRKLKIRFKEVADEREKNIKGIEMKNTISEEEIKYAEIKENEDNYDKCQEAKEKFMILFIKHTLRTNRICCEFDIVLIFSISIRL